MLQTTYRRTGPDGSVTTVHGLNIFDHVDRTILDAQAFATVLAAQDPAQFGFCHHALYMNREMMDRVCDLLAFMSAYVLERSKGAASPSPALEHPPPAANGPNRQAARAH